MSQNNDKSYQEYLRQLENQITRSVDTSGSARDMGATSPRPVARRRRLRKTPLIVFTALVVVIAVLSAVALSGARGKEPEYFEPPVETASENESSQPYEEEFNPEIERSVNIKDIPADNDAKSAVVVNLTDNKVIAARNSDLKVFPASTTKIMTLITAVDYIDDFDDTVTITYQITDPAYVKGATMAGFLNDEEVSMTDLLYGLILPSGADAAAGLAVKIAGSEENFVKLMNQKAQSLGLKNTHFANASGLHHEENYTTAYDMAIILKAAVKNKLCRRILSTPKYTTYSTNKHPDGIDFRSTLFSYIDGDESKTAYINGGKTGFVSMSGYCIASFGIGLKSQEEYLVVTMGNSARKPAFSGQVDLYDKLIK